MVNKDVLFPFGQVEERAGYGHGGHDEPAPHVEPVHLVLLPSYVVFAGRLEQAVNLSVFELINDLFCIFKCAADDVARGSPSCNLILLDVRLLILVLGQDFKLSLDLSIYWPGVALFNILIPPAVINRCVRLDLLLQILCVR